MIWLMGAGLVRVLDMGAEPFSFLVCFVRAAARSWNDVDIVDGGGPRETSVGSGGWEES